MASDRGPDQDKNSDGTGLLCMARLDHCALLHATEGSAGSTLARMELPTPTSPPHVTRESSGSPKETRWRRRTNVRRSPVRWRSTSSNWPRAASARCGSRRNAHVGRPCRPRALRPEPRRRVSGKRYEDSAAGPGPPSWRQGTIPTARSSSWVMIIIESPPQSPSQRKTWMSGWGPRSVAGIEASNVPLPAGPAMSPRGSTKSA